MSLTPTGRQPAARTPSVRAAGATARPTSTEEPVDDLLRGTCPACSATIGETHADDCDVAECLVRGLKRMYCQALVDPEGHDCGASTWTGDWPGHREAREFGWHVRWDVEAQTWARCDPDVPGSGPDLNRLYQHARWDPSARRWLRRRAVVFTGTVRGGRAAAEELAKVAQRWCAQEGLDVVCQHVGSRSWRCVVADVAACRAELVVVPSVAALGNGRQVFERLGAVRGAGGDIAGPGLRIDADGAIVAASAGVDQ
ncbi:hypothetical protein [Micromonospora sp. NPDC048839]|uniref:hypothetical protein n=1 Tax=Micromonospora sp. NPDC048839 TaxID=3155641 RepID=UPI0033CFA7F6